MYTNLGYTVYRQVLGYYSGENSEDAYGKSERVVMTCIRKSFSHDAVNEMLSCRLISFIFSILQMIHLQTCVKHWRGTRRRPQWSPCWPPSHPRSWSGDICCSRRKLCSILLRLYQLYTGGATFCNSYTASLSLIRVPIVTAIVIVIVMIDSLNEGPAQGLGVGLLVLGLGLLSVAQAAVDEATDCLRVAAVSRVKSYGSMGCRMLVIFSLLDLFPSSSK